MTGSPNRLDLFLQQELGNVGAEILFCSFAYVSTYGAYFLKKLAASCKTQHVKLICDTRDCVTHPKALSLGLENKWDIKVVNRSQGTFHPKFLIAGDYSKNEIIGSAHFLSIGSGNLSRGGLISNIECGYRRWDSGEIASALALAKKVWALGSHLTSNDLDAYEKRFQKRNKQRSIPDLDALGVSDAPPSQTPTTMANDKPEPPSFSTAVADAAWTGLESFTGDYTFQVEFPSEAGKVLDAIIASVSPGGKTPMLCSDGEVRDLTYAYYDHNGMFRLNIPNDVPGVDAARQSHSGIALVELQDGGPATLRLTVSTSTPVVAAARARSLALGTWGKTSTRLYGWY